MKNIHIIPTDKPSRLGYLTKKGKQVFNDLRLFDRVMPNILDSENQHLYITNDEEIIEGDWCIDKHKVVYKQETDKIFSEFTGSKKIILTTDTDLIKDGVQSIDDEFLEWFVKNPSCEEVKIEKENICARCYCNDPDDCWSAKECSDGKFNKIKYKLIIKKEPKQLNLEYFGLPKIGTKEFNDLASGLFGGKPKQEKLTYTESAKKEERISNSIMMKRKQETVEDAAENNWDKINSEYKNGLNPYAHKIGFIEGAEWMQDRMYSEEDLISFAHFYFQEEFKSTMQNSNKSIDEILQEWFNQFKKTKQDETT